MKPELIRKITATQNETRQLAIITECYANKEFTIDELLKTIRHGKLKLIISISVLKQFAAILQNGSPDKFEKNMEDASKLLEYVAAVKSRVLKKSTTTAAGTSEQKSLQDSHKQMRHAMNALFKKIPSKKRASLPPWQVSELEPPPATKRQKPSVDKTEESEKSVDDPMTDVTMPTSSPSRAAAAAALNPTTPLRGQRRQINVLANPTKSTPTKTESTTSKKTPQKAGTPETPRTRKINLQGGVGSLFFTPSRATKVTTKKLAKEIVKKRFIPTDSPIVFNSSTSGRARLVAEGAQNKAVLMGMAAQIPTVSEQSFFQNQLQMGPVQKNKVSDTMVSYQPRVFPEPKHPGDCFVFNIGSYREIISVINKITGGKAENEKQLAQYMLRYFKSSVGIKLDELEKIKETATQEDCDKLNAFFVLLDKESTRRTYPVDSRRQLPMPMANALAVRLIAMNQLTMKEVFSPDAPYGVFTGKKLSQNYDKIAKKIKRINAKYEEAEKREDFPAEWKTKAAKSEIMKYRKILSDIFGGDNESESEEYTDELIKSSEAERKKMVAAADDKKAPTFTSKH